MEHAHSLEDMKDSSLHKDTMSRRSSTDSPHQRYSDPVRKASQTSNGSNRTTEQSPLHHKVAPNTPGRFKTSHAHSLEDMKDSSSHKDTMSGRSSTGSPHQRYSDPVRKASQTSNGSNHTVEQSPLHHKVAPNTPGRFKTSPDKSPSVPEFGAWNESNPSTADGYTDIFDQVREEKQTGSAKVPQITDDSMYINSYHQSGTYKSSSYCCFGWCK